jgi:hypothetical protein
MAQSAPVVTVALAPAPVLLPPLNAAPPPPPPQQVALANGKLGWMDQVSPTFFNGLPTKDRDTLERVFTSLSNLHEQEQDFPTEVALQRHLAEDGKTVLWYNCVAYGYLKPLLQRETNTLQQEFGQLTRDVYVSLVAQGERQQSRGALILEAWSHDHYAVRTQQRAQLDASHAGTGANKRGRTSTLLGVVWSALTERQ